jgi:hypothetical protein
MGKLVSDLAAIATAVTLSAPHNGFERQNGTLALWWTCTTDSRQAKMGKREFTFLVASLVPADVDSCQLTNRVYNYTRALAAPRRIKVDSCQLV